MTTFTLHDDVSRCQGCGVGAGAEIVVAKASRAREERREPARLQTVFRLDYGQRLYCQRCRPLARRAAGRVLMAHRVVSAS